MIATTYGGKSVFLFNNVPNWQSAVDVTFEVQAKRITGKTNREEREPMGRETVATMQFSVLLNSDESSELRTALDAWDNRPILCPFWPAMTKLFGVIVPSTTGFLKLWFEADFSRWEIGTGAGPSTFTPSAACLVAPLMWGRFVAFPELTPINGLGDHTSRIEIVENGSADYAIRPNATALTTAVVNTQTVPVLTVPFTWGDNTAQLDVRIKRDKIGFGRGDADDFYPQFPRTKQTMRFAALDGTDLRYLLTLFRDRYGSVKPWQCPKVHDTLSMMLGRFYGDALRISWENCAIGAELANGSIEFISLPTESIALVGETPGVTIGGLGGRWFGYVVTDGYQTWRFTSFESPIVGPGGYTFDPQKIDHGTIVEEINLQLNDCTLDVQVWPGSPFIRLRSQHASPSLTVQIYEGRIADTSTAQLIFTGLAQAPEGEGAHWKIKLTGTAAALLSMKGPRTTAQPTCINVFGDTWCKKDIASVSSTQTLVSTVSGVSEFTTGVATTFPDHRFAAGCAKRPINGTIQRYLIVDSHALPNGNLGIVLSGTVSPPPSGAEPNWILEPGCPGTEAACKGYGNFVNMRAALRAPKANPAMVGIKSGGSGKK